MTATSASPRPSSGTGTSSMCSDLGIPVACVEAVEHVLFVPVQGDGAVSLRQRHRGKICGLAARVEDRVEYLFHGRLLIPLAACCLRLGLPPRCGYCRWIPRPVTKALFASAATASLHQVQNTHYGR